MCDFEIYFSDLTYGAQQRLMKAVGVEEPEEMNWDMDIFPIAYYPILDQEDEDIFDINLYDLNG